MTDTTTRTTPAPAADQEPVAGQATGGLFRAVWRWHFFAASSSSRCCWCWPTTGLIYLFRFQIEPLLHADLMRVDDRGATPSRSRTTSSSRPSSASPPRRRPSCR